MRFLLVTEDSGNQAIPTIERIAKKMLLWMDGSVDPERAGWLPGSDRRASDVLTASARVGWKALNPRQQRELVQFLATKLVSGGASPVFIILHTDGDIPWGDSAGGTSGPGVADLSRRVLGPLRRLLGAHEREELIAHVFTLMPFYSIESWLYQNTVALRQIYARHFPGHATVSLVEEWAAHPELVDEVVDPKEVLAPVGNGYNLLLAESLPVRKSHDVGKSFCACLDRFQACEPLVRGIAALRR